MVSDSRQAGVNGLTNEVLPAALIDEAAHLIFLFDRDGGHTYREFAESLYRLFVLKGLREAPEER